MSTVVTRGKLLIIGMAMGLGLLAMVACGSGTATPSDSPQPVTGQTSQLADLLGSQLASGALKTLSRNLSGNPTTANSGIWVSGRGEASAAPDLAILNLGVEAFADSVSEARSSAAGAMSETLKVLRVKGIDDRDLQTRSFSIKPRYTTREVTRCGDEEGPDISVSREGPKRDCVVDRESVLIGFQVNNQLTIKIRDLDAVGGIIDDVTEAGGDLSRFQSISFTIEDTKALQDQARAAAIQDLLTKAQQVAGLAGVTLGELRFITETGGVSTPRVASIERDFAASAAPTPILSGELDIVITVQGNFGIKQIES